MKILCTLGPASLRPDVIRRLDASGVDIFRVNLSHTELSDLEQVIRLVQSHTDRPVCLDTEGAQVRTRWVSPGLSLAVGATVRLTSTDVLGTADVLPLRPAAFLPSLFRGSTVAVDFDGALLEVTEVAPESADAIVVQGGRVGSNKAVTIHPSPHLPALSDKDRHAIAVGVRTGVRHYALSFASGSSDVAELRSLLPDGSYVISKVESRLGVRSMNEIISTSDAVLIDRGDLSREIPIEYVPYYQKEIVRRANNRNKPVFVATNLLETMVTGKRPTVAEANDIANTLMDGVHGLVLAAETAVGIDPVGTVGVIQRAIKAFEQVNDSRLLVDDRTPAPTVAPTGAGAAA